mmetsp:Transcript_36555/g.86522  ORF Transcript_36555/g.86522 Transcript_36555/m.86522 type:complete len:255 (-) Transcript_36555:481-1245(-)
MGQLPRLHHPRRRRDGRSTQERAPPPDRTPRGGGRDRVFVQAGPREPARAWRDFHHGVRRAARLFLRAREHGPPHVLVPQQQGSGPRRARLPLAQLGSPGSVDAVPGSGRVSRRCDLKPVLAVRDWGGACPDLPPVHADLPRGTLLLRNAPRACEVQPGIDQGGRPEHEGDDEAGRGQVVLRQTLEDQRSVWGALEQRRVGAGGPRTPQGRCPHKLCRQVRFALRRTPQESVVVWLLGHVPWPRTGSHPGCGAG